MGTDTEANISICNRTRESQFWLLHCFYGLLQSLNNKSELCMKWNVEVGSFIHCVWACRYIDKCWKDVENQLCLILDVKSKKRPRVYCLDSQTQNFKVHIPKDSFLFSTINSSSGWTANRPTKSWMVLNIFGHVTHTGYVWGPVPLTRAIVTKGLLDAN